MGYGTRVLLEDASFDVQRGEILVILGGSGCGKSSLMKMEQTIGRSVPLSESTPEALVQGYGGALAEVLSELSVALNNS
jgi:ABC-type multidrug transport system ATPase subunit